MSNNPEHKEDTHSLDQAKAQLAHIQDMTTRMAEAFDNDDVETAEQIEQEIYESPLCVERVQSYEILLCTGGPAVRIIGTLDEHGEPDSVVLQHQDRGTPWTDVDLVQSDVDALLDYARKFYFGEG